MTDGFFLNKRHSMSTIQEYSANPYEEYVASVKSYLKPYGVNVEFHIIPYGIDIKWYLKSRGANVKSFIIPYGTNVKNCIIPYGANVRCYIVYCETVDDAEYDVEPDIEQ